MKIYVVTAHNYGDDYSESVWHSQELAQRHADELNERDRKRIDGHYHVVNEHTISDVPKED